MTPDVVVVGAGFAGLSAAVRLAAGGLRVVVAEEKPRLGGRATAFADRDTGERVDNGQHVLFGCYRETYAFLEAIGTAALAPLQPRLRLLMAGEGESFLLECPALPPPWHLLVGLMRWKALGLADRLSVLRLRGVLTAARRRGADAVARAVPAAETASAWLQRHHQTPQTRRWLWEPLAIAALNQSPDVAAAAPFVRVIGELFGPRATDSTVGLPAVPLDELYALPARRAIEACGGRVLERTRARVAIGQAGRFRVQLGHETVDVGLVVSTVPWFDVTRLWQPDVPAVLGDIAAHARAMTSCSIVTANLWFDGPVAGVPFVGLVDGPMHWAFDKTVLFANREAGHLSVVASGADALASQENAAITDLAVAQLTRALPGVRQRRLLRSVIVREQRATFSVAPGAPPRPSMATPLPGFFLAGDWVDTGLPGTIESAVTSGHGAAELALRYWRGERSIPVDGG